MDILRRFWAWLSDTPIVSPSVVVPHDSSTVPYFTGNVEDPRLQEAKDKDWAHEERAMAKPLGPFDHQQIKKSPYPYEHQWYTSSCTPHGVGLALAIERKADVGGYTRLAPIFVYRLRANYPSEGCWLQNVFDIYRNTGAPLFTTLPTPEREAQANALTLSQAMYDEAAIFKGFNYYTIKEKWNDINVLGDIAQMGHAVPILFYANRNEWSRDYPVILNPHLRSGEAEVSHCVTILPNSGFTKNGIKYLTIQDSAAFGGMSLRHLSEEFVKARVFAAGYWDKVVPLGSGAYPHYIFSTDLSVGMQNDNVRAMQKLFIAEGLLANENATGYFGGKTLAALHAFQDKYRSEILDPNGLSKPTNTFGPASRAVANKLCA